MKKFLKILKWAVITIIILFIVWLAVGWWWLGVKTRTADALWRIENRRITIDDVMGKNLPPVPDEKLNNSTLAGIDANNNYIRDDVELAIFEKYPNSAKMRAAMLQYAQELQPGLTSVFNKETWVAANKRINDGTSCLIDLAFNKYTDTKDQIYKSGEWFNEIEDLVFNNNLRKIKIEQIKKYDTSYAVGEGKCDIDFSLLPN